MKIKVCGMRDTENISGLIALKPDFVGFIFYKNSKRFVADFPQIKFPDSIKKVGVFVKEDIQEVLRKVKAYNLDCIQLHGNETPEYCQKLSQSDSIPNPQHLIIIKAFSVDNSFDFKKTEAFKKCCDYFLFDTKGKDYGGTGEKFNWEILQNYKGTTPYFLSGGITKNDVDQIASFQKRKESKRCVGIDINSGFETAPALKNINYIKEFKNNLQ
jgi:phosphoribosylanthranilate isomerase